MGNLSKIGRIFYGISIAAMGLQTIYFNDLPYMMIPAKHSWIDSLVVLYYISGALLLIAGLCIALRKNTMTVSLLLGTALLMVFCFYFIPYQLMSPARYTNFGSWENAAKELTLAAGAFVIAGCFSENNENPLIGRLRKLIPLGTILFAITIISYGINHFLNARGASGYVPSWIPNRIFWVYMGGIGLLGCGIAILLKIKAGLFAMLLGAMIFIWVLILHIPYAIAAPLDYKGSEITSLFLALAYCGIAFVIAGPAKRRV